MNSEFILDHMMKKSFHVWTAELQFVNMLGWIAEGRRQAQVAVKIAGAF